MKIESLKFLKQSKYQVLGLCFYVGKNQITNHFILLSTYFITVLILTYDDAKFISQSVYVQRNTAINKLPKLFVENSSEICCLIKAMVIIKSVNIIIYIYMTNRSFLSVVSSQNNIDLILSLQASCNLLVNYRRQTSSTSLAYADGLSELCCESFLHGVLLS